MKIEIIILALTTANLSFITAIIGFILYKKTNTHSFMFLFFINFLSFLIFLCIFLLYFIPSQLYEFQGSNLIRKILNHIILIWSFFVMVFYTTVFVKDILAFLKKHKVSFILFVLVYSLLIALNLIDISFLNLPILLFNRIIIFSIFIFITVFSLYHRKKLSYRPTRYYLIIQSLVYTCLFLISFCIELPVSITKLPFYYLDIWLICFSSVIIIWCLLSIKLILHIDNIPQLIFEKRELSSFTKKNSISDRELEIIMYLIKGESYKEIAEQLFISYQTVKTHVNNIYKKCSVRSKTELLNLVLVQIKKR